MSWVLAVGGLAALILVHEAGHFAVAKAVGMRVERFSLFFGRPIVKVRAGETEYAIGWLPLGGYVKIGGMAPDMPPLPRGRPGDDSELEKPPDPRIVAEQSSDSRGFYRQATWKRIAMVAAGPVVNIAVAFLLFWALLLSHSLSAAQSLGTDYTTPKIDQIDRAQPATGILRRGDVLVAVDGVRGPVVQLARQIQGHACRGTPTAGCVATVPTHLVVRRGAQTLAFTLRPRFDARLGFMRLGFAFGDAAQQLGPASAARIALDRMWSITTTTVTGLAHAIFSSKARHQLTSVVGITAASQQAFAFNTVRALVVVAFISLVLAVVNLFPFLPLDGGHILWAAAERLRGRPITFQAMMRYSSVGVVLLIFLVVNGLSNDIGRLTGGGFH